MFGGHSVYYWLASFLAWCLVAVLDLVTGNTLGAVTVLDAVPAPVWSYMTEWLGFFSYWIDWGFFFTCLSALFAWRSFWLVTRFWRLILTLIPLAG